MKYAIGFLLTCVSISACLHYGKASDVEPHWVALPTPYGEDKTYGAIISVPEGFKLCGIVSGSSSIRTYIVPLDEALGCEQLPQIIDPPNMPDFVEIGGFPDAALQYQTTKDYVDAEPFYCHGLNYDRPPKRITQAPITVASAGTAIADLQTMTCTQEDQNGRYAKAFMAYLPKTDSVGHEYRIAAYVSSQNKRKADALLDGIVHSFKLLK